MFMDEQKLLSSYLLRYPDRDHLFFFLASDLYGVINTNIFIFWNEIGRAYRARRHDFSYLLYLPAIYISNFEYILPAFDDALPVGLLSILYYCASTRTSQ